MKEMSTFDLLVRCRGRECVDHRGPAWRIKSNSCAGVSIRVYMDDDLTICDQVWFRTNDGEPQLLIEAEAFRQ